ncbi:MAG: fibronectin type III domain-containing protein [Ruminococcus sp.]|nr:fibronectin type III domain-containing protein [Ruminococcus sp.]MCI6505709.1 fibronectin type III domain-containing protein [Ruminococcus sp.]
MKHKKGKVISLILSATVVLSSVCAFNFSALADDASNNDTPSTTESTTNPTTESSAVDSSSTECSTTDISATTPSTEPTTIEEPISVGKLTNLKATKVTLKYVSVKWNKAENATNYKIEYRKAGKNYKFKTLKTIKGTGATVPKLSANTLYYIKVTPFATKDNKTYYGSNAIIKVATATTSINGLKVTNNGKAISIKWNRNKNATGYKVYRLNSKKKYVQVKTIKDNKKTAFKDTKVKSGKIYYYKVKAYRTYNGYGTVLSDYSKQVFSPCGLYATTVKTKSFSGKITVSWSKVSGASGYKVYQSKSKNKGYKCVAKTTKRSYTTKKLIKNKTYYFKVQPYKSYKGKEINPTAKPKVKSQKVISSNSGSSSGHGPAIRGYKDENGISYSDGKGNNWDDSGNSWKDSDMNFFTN